MNHDFDNDNDNDMDDDDAEEVPRAPKPPKNGAAAKAPKKSSNKESERKKRELITMGKAKGFLTYDEVNEHMPENIVSSDQIDDWLSAFSRRGHRDRRFVVEGEGRPRETPVTPRPRPRKRKKRPRPPPQEGRGRGGGRLRRLLEDQRPGAHVPAQDGLGLAAHPRGRGRDRQAHRGGRAARAAGRAQLVGRGRGDPRARRQAAQAEDPRQGGRQGRGRRGRRVRRAVAHRARLQGDRQGPALLDKSRRRTSRS